MAFDHDEGRQLLRPTVALLTNRGVAGTTRPRTVGAKPWRPLDAAVSQVPPKLLQAAKGPVVVFFHVLISSLGVAKCRPAETDFGVFQVLN